jgi:tetratricopeptide (TPR) repeat protein
MSHSVLVETARLFIGEFYKELLTGKRVGQAMLAGQRALKSDTFRGKTFTGELRLEDWFVPVLFQEEQDPQLIREVPAQQVASVIEKKKDLALGELPDEPPHQFLGRSRDLLKAERILAQKRYLVVLGSGGEGKTSHARFDADRAAIDRLIEQGRPDEAVRAAQILHAKADAAGDSVYSDAAYDRAMAQITLGRALGFSGNAESALPHLDKASKRFERLNEPRMVGVALADKAGCLIDIGWYEEASDTYEKLIEIAKKTGDQRSIAVGMGQLGRVRHHQKKFSEALQLYTEALRRFEHLSEPASAGTTWHQIGVIYEEARQYKSAEAAYQRSLNIRVQIGNRFGQASTLAQLGSLYGTIGRVEDAVRIYRQAAEIFVAIGDIRNEGSVHANIAYELINLRSYDEARLEIDRAIGCLKTFGHAAQPWNAFAILSDLEHAVGNQRAALAARSQAIDAYLIYRRDGGAPQFDTFESIALVHHDPHAARAALGDPSVHYSVAAEILLALEGRS